MVPPEGGREGGRVSVLEGVDNGERQQDFSYKLQERGLQVPPGVLHCRRIRCVRSLQVQHTMLKP